MDVGWLHGAVFWCPQAHGAGGGAALRAAYPAGTAEMRPVLARCRVDGSVHLVGGRQRCSVHQEAEGLFFHAQDLSAVN